MCLSASAFSVHPPLISVFTITHFALKQLVVGNDQLLFLCCLGNVFDVSQQLVFIEELSGKKCKEEKVNM